MNDKLLDELTTYSDYYIYEEKLKEYILKEGINNIDKYLDILFFKKYSYEFCDVLFKNGYRLSKSTINKDCFDCSSIRLYIEKYLTEDNKKDFFDFVTQYDKTSTFFVSEGRSLTYELAKLDYKPEKNGSLKYNSEYYIYYLMLNIDNKKSAKKFIEDECGYSIDEKFYKLLYEKDLLNYVKNHQDVYFFILSNFLAYEIYLNRTKDISFLNDVHVQKFTNKAIELIFSLGYEITEKSPWSIQNNPLAFAYALKNGSNLHVLRYSKFQEISDELIYIMFEKGYKINSLSYSWILTSELAFSLALKNGQNANIINYAQMEFSDKFIKNILDNEYKCDVSKLNFSRMVNGLSFKLYYDANKNKPDFDIQIIDKLSIYLNTEIIIDIICEVDCNYKITENSPTYILSSEKAFRAALSKGQDINIINYSEIYDVSSDFIDLCLSDKYNYSIYSNSPKFILSSKYSIEKYLLKNKNKEIDLNFLNRIEFDVDNNFLRKIFEYGYRINYLTPDEFLENESLMKEYYDLYVEKNEINSKYLNLLNNNYGLTNSIVGTFKNQDFLTLTPQRQQLYLLKYVYFNHSCRVNYREKFVNIINNNLYSDFIKIYNLLYDEWNIKKVLELVEKYEKHIDLFNEIINSNYELNYNEKRIIKICFEKDIYLFNISGIKKLNKEMSNNNLVLIKSNKENIKSLKDIIFKMLCAKSYDEMSMFLGYIFNARKYYELYHSINNKKLLLDLKNYKQIMEIIEKIFYCEDKVFLKNLASTINDSFYKNDNITNELWNIFNDIENTIRYFYGEEINEKLTNVNKLLVNENYKEYDVKKDFYQVPYSFDLDGKIIEKNTKVDYVELKGIPFVFLAHTINAYGNGGNISNFYENRLIGKSYICLSAFDDLRAKSVVNKEVNNINDVTILFDNIDSSNLVAFSYEDLNSSGDDNSLNIFCNKPMFNSIRETIMLTTTYLDSHNEYIYYRDGIKPCGILTYQKPNEYQIMAAAYLNVPIVRINIQYYPQSMLNKDEEEQYEKQISEYYKTNYNQVYNNIKESNVKILSKEFFNRYFK